MSREIAFMACHRLHEVSSAPVSGSAPHAYVERFCKSDSYSFAQRLFLVCQQEGVFKNQNKFLGMLEHAGWIGYVLNKQRVDALGAALLVPIGQPDYPAFEAHLEYVMTHPSARGQGIASAIVAALLEKAKEMNIACVRLTCAPGLIGMYQGMGFCLERQYTVP